MGGEPTTMQGPGEEVALLRDQLAQIELQNRLLMDTVADLEQRCTNLAKLYAAARQIHGATDKQGVLTAIQEIVVNFVGSEQLAVLEAGASAVELRPVVTMGVPADACQGLTRPDPVEKALATGEPCVAATPGEPLAVHEGLPIMAVVPLMRDGKPRGAIVVFRPVPQKRDINRLDHQMFDLLRSDAALALHRAATAG